MILRWSGRSIATLGGLALGSALLAGACSGGGGGGTETSPACLGGESLCGDVCVDITEDEEHCGACDAACGPGQLCESAECVDACEVGETVCDDGCVELDADPGHCGACGNACGANESCLIGSCTPCEPGQIVCGNTCVFLEDNPNHCGACGVECGDGDACDMGQCVAECPFGSLACPGEGCVDVQFDPEHCGSCGNVCDTGAMCDQGACVGDCPSGEQWCGGSCVDVSTSDEHCGGCDSPCQGAESCAGGTCQAACGDGERMCGDACVDTSSSSDHCGACDNACEFPNASAECDAGLCQLAACDSGWADTDNDPGNGCEEEVPRRAFVTSTTHLGNLGGVAGADAICQTRADAESLGGTWRAWISDGDLAPATRFTQTSSPIVRLDNAVPIAADWADLTDGAIQNAIRVTEKGLSAGITIVWTGTAADGTSAGADHCAGWTSSAANTAGVSGSTAPVDAGWTNDETAPCNTKRRLYCFEL